MCVCICEFFFTLQLQMCELTHCLHTGNHEIPFYTHILSFFIHKYLLSPKKTKSEEAFRKLYMKREWIFVKTHQYIAHLFHWYSYERCIFGNVSLTENIDRLGMQRASIMKIHFRLKLLCIFNILFFICLPNSIVIMAFYDTEYFVQIKEKNWQ